MTHRRRILVPAKKAGFIRAAWRMLRDPSTPFLQKLILIIGAWYWGLPEPTDLLPVIGWADEAGVTGWFLFLLWHARRRYREQKALETDR